MAAQDQRETVLRDSCTMFNNTAAHTNNTPRRREVLGGARTQVYLIPACAGLSSQCIARHLDQHHAAIHSDHTAGYVVGGAASQKERDLANIVGLAEPSQRQAFGQIASGHAGSSRIFAG